MLSREQRQPRDLRCLSRMRVRRPWRRISWQFLFLNEWACGPTTLSPSTAWEFLLESWDVWTRHGASSPGPFDESHEKRMQRSSLRFATAWRRSYFRPAGFVKRAYLWPERYSFMRM